MWTAFLSLLIATGSAAKKSDLGCTVTSVWPDGTEATRECIVDGEGGGSKRAPKQEIGKDFSWLKDTRWFWNEWRDVIFKADGSFLAPAEGCERPNPKCKWYTVEDEVHVRFGGAGVHALSINAENSVLTGQRESDGEPVTATIKES
mmetsp:Transcript_39275/g.65178  ORF Transcript_39275/g.65178 Transcript_39275/m.65178 type:complete len:147 (-) Transcript_39275:305-745(-)|eukprot:CAMPEP_0119330278 /NCGR_PEP_ID=MMETSP1333-20130426/77903_1 /TAXON_ID=418940 /ORGANISM="Scyphosphaera apsteinii, Strain RCC1455" /LENGTH=146 /DNA_ID=CAMNT_0007339633 /DNA_START=34 /DNA_END=474 /DNA_ORIENTATION=+